MLTQAELRERARNRKKKLREERRGKGLCTYCGKPTQPNRFLCPSCLENHKKYSTAEKSRALYHKRRAKGLCTKCGKPESKGHGGLCDECADLRKAPLNSYSRKLYAERKALGLCPKCGESAVQGTVYCLKCAEKNNIYRKERYALYKDTLVARNALKRMAMVKLSGYPPRCERCGCDAYKALEFNHKNGGGRQESKTQWEGKLWKQILDEGRHDINILCRVCNAAEYAEKRFGLKWHVQFVSGSSA